MKTFKLKNFLSAIALSVIFTSVLTAETIPVSIGNSEKFLPASEKSMNGNIQDGILICWIDETNNGTLFIQKLNKFGKHEWKENGLTIEDNLGSGFISDSDYPSVFSDNNGGAVIIYRKVFAESEKIYSSKVTADGSINEAVCLSSFYGGYNFSPRSVYTSDNCISVVWENFTDGNFNIHAQKLNLDGIKLWNGGKEVIVCGEPGDERKPTVISDGNSNLIFTWLDSRNSNQQNEFGLDLYANKLDADGRYTEYGNSGKLILSYGKSLTEQKSFHKSQDMKFGKGKGPGKIQKITFYNHNLILSDNNSVIAAADIWHLDEDSFLKIIKFDEDLEIVWENKVQEESFQYNPLIISDGKYGACVIWNDGRNNENGIFGIMYDKHGNQIAGNKNGIKFSFDDNKDNLMRLLPDRNNNNGLSFHNNRISVPWVTSSADNLYLASFDLLVSFPFKCDPLKISNNVLLGKCISVNYLNEKPVTIFLKDNTVYADMNLTVKSSDNRLNENLSLSNFPNPFNPVTKISYEIPSELKGSNNVSVKIFDLTGKEVAVLVNETQIAGKYEVVFNGNNLASGTYITKIKVKEFTQVRKIILMK